MNKSISMAWCATSAVSGPAGFTRNRAAARKKAIAQAVLSAAAFASGTSALASGADAIETGSAANASGDFSIAIGKQASAPDPYAVALGMQASAQGNGAIATGLNANAQGDGADAVGLNANAQGSGANAIGMNAIAQGNGAAALGLGASALGAGATAVGLNASALNDRATAVGLNAVAQGIDSISSGSAATATDAAASAFGALATASGSASTAVGYRAQTLGGAALAGGGSALAAADRSIALGSDTTASAFGGIALGSLAQATGLNASALGFGAMATAAGAVALGNYATAAAANSVALGANSTTAADLTQPAYAPAGLGATLIAAPDPTGEVSLGSENYERRLTKVAAGAAPTDAVNVSQLSAIDGKVDAIVRGGTQRYFKADGSVDGADDAVAAGAHALAAGAGASATGVDAAAVGAGARAGGTGSAVVGASAVADATHATSIGASAVAGEVNATSIGASATAGGSNATAIGAYSAVGGDGSIALGYRASASADNAVALGRDSLAERANTVSVGSAGQERQLTNVAAGTAATDAVNLSQLDAATTAASRYFKMHAGDPTDDSDDASATGNDAVAIGKSALGAGESSIAAGSDSLALGDFSAAIGGHATAGSDGSAALGYNANAAAAGSVALGYNASTIAAGSVALGQGSIADREETISVGSVGHERQITNVAAGTADSDAVNVAQLKAVSDRSEANAVRLDGALAYDQNTDGSFNRDSVTLSGSAASGGTVIHNVAAGTAGTDAVNVTQLKTVSDQGEANATRLDGALMYDQNADGSIDRDSVTLGGSAASGGTVIHNVAAGTAGTDAVNVTQLKTVSDQGEANATRLDGALMYDKNADGSIDRHSVTLGDNTASGETVIHKVAAGTTDTDAVNVAQLKTVSDRSEANTTKLDGALMYDQNADGTIDRNSVTLAGSTASGGTVIHNVAPGTADTDAVNVAQLKTVSDQSEANTTKLDGALMYDQNADGTIDRNSVTLAGSTANSGTVIHNVAPGTANTDAVNVAQLKTVSDQSEANTAKLDGALMYDRNADGTINRNSFTLGGSAVSGGTVIHNVAPGTADTDAVNVAQLKTVSDQSEANTAKLDGALMYDRNADGTTNRNSVTLGDDASSGGTIIHNVADGVNASDAVNLGQLNAVVNGAVNHAVVNAANSFISAEGNRDTEGAVSSGAHSLAAGANAQATGASAAAIGANAIAGGNDATALGAAANASADNSVALGHGSVADRANAVSIGSAGQERQIINVAAGVHGTDAVNVNQLQQSVSGAISEANHYTDDQIRSTRRDGYGGTASALAVAGLPQAVLPGHGMFAIAAGTYGGQSALAIGVSQFSDKGTWIYKLQGTTDSRGQLGASIGAGVHW